MATSEGSTGKEGAGNAGVPDSRAAQSLRQRLAKLIPQALSMLPRLAVLTGFFALAALGSWYLRSLGEIEEGNTAVSGESKVPAKSALPADNPIELLGHADQALRQYRFALALSLYEELRDSSSAHGPLIDYRYALCNESIGQFDKAIAGYRSSISGMRSPALTFTSHLGLARCLFCQGKFAEARRLLYPFLFDESRQRNLPQAFVSDARYLLALSLSREAMEAIRAGSVSDGPPAAKPGWKEEEKGKESERQTDSPGHWQLTTVSSIGLEIPYYLDELRVPAMPPTQSASEKPVEKKPAEVPLAPVKKRAETQGFVREVDMDRPASEVLELLAIESGIPIKLSEDARKALADRSLRLCLQNWYLDDLLEPIADYLGLAFRVEGTNREICTLPEIETKQLTAYQRDRSIRALRGVLLTDGTHAWAAAACLELGNWEAAQGKLPEATTWFERLARQSPNSPYAAAAYFNLGLIHLEKQDPAAARAAFFRVVDHSPGHDLALQAFIRIGLSHLENDECKEAIVNLRHAQATSPHSAQHARATVALAAAYLLNQQPEIARIILAQDRAAFLKSPCKATAAFLDTYAQYQLAKKSSPGHREASDLLSTLLRDQDQTVLGPLGDYIIAQSYRDLGFLGSRRTNSTAMPGASRNDKHPGQGSGIFSCRHFDETATPRRSDEIVRKADRPAVVFPCPGQAATGADQTGRQAMQGMCRSLPGSLERPLPPRHSSRVGNLGQSPRGHARLRQGRAVFFG